MACVKAVAIGGMYLWIPSGDHGPAHIHARRRAGEWKAKVRIHDPPGTMVYDLKGKMSPRDRRTLTNVVEAKRESLLAEWEAINRDR